MTVLETERLLIQEWQPEDWLPFHSIATDPEVMRYIGAGAIWSDERTQQFIARQINQAKTLGYCLWKLVSKSSNQLIGHCGLQPLWGTGETEIGWWLARREWGKGLATEAARAALQDGLARLQLKRIIAIAQPANLASLNIMRKLGMQFERRTTHGAFGQPNPEIELALYAIEQTITN